MYLHSNTLHSNTMNRYPSDVRGGARGPNGRVPNVLESTYAEVVGQRGTAFAELPNQFNFLVPPGVSLGYQPVRIIQGCGTSNEVRSEPQ